MSYIDLAKLNDDPASPPEGYLRMYVKSNGIWIVDDDGSVLGQVMMSPLMIPGATVVTISTGSITPIGMYHSVAIEDPLLTTDDLDTIVVPAGFNVLILRPSVDDKDVVIKHNTGNIMLRDETDVTLDNSYDHILLFYDGTQWVNLL